MILDFESATRRHPTVLAAVFSLVVACAGTQNEVLTLAHRRALTDSLTTIFDSLSAIHRDHPDTGLLRRLHPPADTIQFVEGGLIEELTGDSLFRRVLVLHRPVHMMAQRFTNRHAQILDANHVVLTADEKVEWADTAGAHTYAGLLTLTASRRGPAWVIRSYRGS